MRLGRHSCRLGPSNCVWVMFISFAVLYVGPQIMRDNATSIYDSDVKADDLSTCVGSHETVKDFPEMFSPSLKYFLIFVHQKGIYCLRRLVCLCSRKCSGIQLSTQHVFNKLSVLYVIKCRFIMSVFCVRVIKVFFFLMKVYCS